MTKHVSCLLILGMLTIGFAAPVFGQFGGGGAPLQPEQEIKIIRLQHINPIEAQRVLVQIFAGQGAEIPGASGAVFRFAADTRTNSLIAHADEDTLKKVEALLVELDANSVNTKDRSEMRVFLIKHADLDDVQSAIVQMTRGAVKIHSDGRTNSLFVNGPTETLEEIRALVQRLDVPVAEESPSTDVAIRIVWLVEAQAQFAAAPVPNDLSAPIEALRKKVGIGELRTAAQLVTQANPNDSGRFELTGTAQLDRLLTIHCTGDFAQVGPKQQSLRVKLSVTDDDSQICKLETTCGALLEGKPIILGATPINSKASVFVIQLLKQ